MSQTNKIRLASYLAKAGVASRRKSEELIKQGKVKVGKNIVTDLATKVAIDSTNISVNNQKIKLESKVYYIINKPLGYVSSVSDPHNKRSVIDLVPKGIKVFPVGRLDKNSQGLLLLTNDGDLAYQLTHPKFEIKKTYLVELDKAITKENVFKLKKGVALEEGLAKLDSIKILSNKKVEVVIHQGWKRQIRRMFDSLTYNVVSLTRIAEGKLKLGNLAVGKYKQIDLKDIV